MEISLDEAIIHAEEVTKEYEESVKDWEETVVWSDFDKELVDMSIIRCTKCAAEHRQLAEWLKDYKQLLERESCENAISRQAVLGYIYNDLGLGDEENGKNVERQKELENSYKYIKSLPPVNPKQKIGHWEETRYRSYDAQSYETYDDGMGFRCSNCANVFKVTSLARYHYCPNCGAKMESEG